MSNYILCALLLSAFASFPHNTAGDQAETLTEAEVGNFRLKRVFKSFFDASATFVLETRPFHVVGQASVCLPLYRSRTRALFKALTLAAAPKLFSAKFAENLTDAQIFQTLANRDGMDRDERFADGFLSWHGYTYQKSTVVHYTATVEKWIFETFDEANDVEVRIPWARLCFNLVGNEQPEAMILNQSANSVGFSTVALFQRKLDQMFRDFGVSEVIHEDEVGYGAGQPEILFCDDLHAETEIEWNFVSNQRFFMKVRASDFPNLRAQILAWRATNPDARKIHVVSSIAPTFRAENALDAARVNLICVRVTRVENS